MENVSIKKNKKIRLDLLVLNFPYVRLEIPCYSRCIEMGILL